MSHFTVLVVCDHTEDQSKLAAMLQPYHEYECTGVEDEYVVDVDKTEEVREQYQKDTTRKLRDAAGNLSCPYDYANYREPTSEEKAEMGPFGGSGSTKSGLSYFSRDWGDGQGYRPKIRFIPEGLEEVELPVKEVQTLAEWASDYYGWPIVHTIGDKTFVYPGAGDDDSDPPNPKYGRIEVDENGEVVRCIDRTNPNAKWDWWVVGGRYSGRLVDKQGRKYDVLKAGEWDLDGQIERYTARFNRYYDDIQNAIAGLPYRSWQDITAELGYGDVARTFYHEQESVKAAKAVKRYDAAPGDAEQHQDTILGYFWDNLSDWTGPRDKVVAAKVWANIGSFAILDKNGWHQKGDMGWWASVSNEDEDWPIKALELVRSLPPEQNLYMVDCHI